MNDQPKNGHRQWHLKRWLLLIICIPCWLHAAKLNHVSIVGVKGPVLLNVQNRLGELYKDKPIASQPEDELRTQVAKALYPYGYFKSHIAIVHPNAGELTITINPGPPLLITALHVTVIGDGAQNPEIQQTLRDLPLRVGQPLLSEQYEQAKNNLFNAAEHQGYLRARFEKALLLIDQVPYTAAITLVLNTGPQYYFGQIRFEPTTISPELLARFAPFKYGQSYSTDQVLKLNSNLAGSGYFKAVNVKPVLDGQRNVPLDVNFQPVNSVNYSVGVGYGTDTGPRGRLGVSVIPVNRAGHKFNAIAQGSFEENTVQGQYIIPGTNPIEDNYSITGGLTNLSYNAGRSNAVLFGVAQQHALTHYQRTLSLNALNEHYNYSGFPSNTETLVFPKAVFSWNNITNQLFSPTGYNVTLAGLAASKAVLSQVNLAQVSLDARAALTVDAVRTRFYFHGIQGFTQIKQINNLPLSLAQLLGGADNLKGYSYNSIGPGKNLSYGGVEVQKETWSKLYFLGFFDAGNVYDPFTKNTKYDAGVGAMWVSPVGPIKIAVAQAINNQWRRDKEHSPKLVVNMGPDL